MPLLTTLLLLQTSLAPQHPRLPTALPSSAGPLYAVTNVGVGAVIVTADGPQLAVGVLESMQGVDLDGDGDTLDQVLHVYDRATGSLTNVGVPHEMPGSIVGRWVVFAAYELPAQTDWNGDGDQIDDVVHVYDIRSGELWNSGLSVDQDHLPWFFYGIFPPRQAIIGDRLVFQPYESAQGEDLNGDGDSLDSVLRSISLRMPAQDPTRPVQAGGLQPLPGTLAVDRNVGFRFASEWILVGFDEHDSLQELNGDGDFGDTVLHAIHARTGQVENLRLAGGFYSAFGERVVLAGSEASQNVDWNGDGDRSDNVFQVLDLGTLSVENTGLAATSAFGLGDVLACLVSEAKHGNADLNGDGDTKDEVLHLLDLGTGSTTNTHLATGGIGENRLGGAGSKFLCQVPEASQGGSDLNGDGDALDGVLHVVTSAGAVTNLATAVDVPFFSGARLVGMQVNESAQRADFNFDGDLNDMVLATYDGDLDRFTNTALASYSYLEIDGATLAFLVEEGGQNANLNGDGDVVDRVLHVFDADTRTTTNLSLAATTAWWDAGNGVLTASIMEHEQGADLNGDADFLDQVLHVVDLR